jgi:hypothetical protein
LLTGQHYVASCKKWSCQPCGKRKAKQIRHRLEGHRFTRLVTLTSSASTTRVTAPVVKQFNYAWKLWKQSLVGKLRKARKARKGFEYLWANELGDKTSHLHKHIAMPWFYFNYKEMRAKLAELNRKLPIGVVCGFGDKRPVNHKRAIGYCLSYVLKDRAVFPRGARRIQTNVPREREERQPGWFFIPKTGLSERHIQELTGEPRLAAMLEAWRWAALTPKLTLIPGDKLHDGNVHGKECAA